MVVLDVMTKMSSIGVLTLKKLSSVQEVRACIVSDLFIMFIKLYVYIIDLFCFNTVLGADIRWQ